jgi:2-iminobutanoate/2-iminopropanoate deaminase
VVDEPGHRLEVERAIEEARPVRAGRPAGEARSPRATRKTSARTTPAEHDVEALSERAARGRRTKLTPPAVPLGFAGRPRATSRLLRIGRRRRGSIPRPVAAKRVVRTEKAPAPFQGAPYNQAVVYGDLVFVAGQVGVDPSTGEVVEGGVEAQTERIMLNIAAILEAAGSSMENLLRCGIFLADFDNFQTVNEVYARHVGSDPPARTTVEVAYLPQGLLVEIDAIAHL